MVVLLLLAPVAMLPLVLALEHLERHLPAEAPSAGTTSEPSLRGSGNEPRRSRRGSRRRQAGGPTARPGADRARAVRPWHHVGALMATDARTEGDGARHTSVLPASPASGGVDVTEPDHDGAIRVRLADGSSGRRRDRWLGGDCMRELASGRRGAARVLAGIVGGTLLLASMAGCSGSGDGSSALKVAQARVSAKEKALSDA